MSQGLKPRFCGVVNVRAEARTYLRGKSNDQSKGNDQSKRNDQSKGNDQSMGNSRSLRGDNKNGKGKSNGEYRVYPLRPLKALTSVEMTTPLAEGNFSRYRFCLRAEVDGKGPGRDGWGLHLKD